MSIDDRILRHEGSGAGRVQSPGHGAHCGAVQGGGH